MRPLRALPVAGLVTFVRYRKAINAVEISHGLTVTAGLPLLPLFSMERAVKNAKE